MCEQNFRVIESLLRHLAIKQEMSFSLTKVVHQLTACTVLYTVYHSDNVHVKSN